MQWMWPHLRAEPCGRVPCTRNEGIYCLDKRLGGGGRNDLDEEAVGKQPTPNSGTTTAG